MIPKFMVTHPEIEMISLADDLSSVLSLTAQWQTNLPCNIQYIKNQDNNVPYYPCSHYDRLLSYEESFP